MPAGDRYSLSTVDDLHQSELENDIASPTQQSTASAFTRPVTDGSAFSTETGKLFLFDSTGPSSIEVIRMWPDPRAWRRLGNGPWRGSRPEIDLTLRPPPTRGRPRWRREAANIRAATERVPEEVRRLIAPLPTHFQWRTLSFAARVDGGLELLASNPTLAAALAHPMAFGLKVNRPLRAARRKVRRKRAHIVEWLGLPPKRSVERLLRRIPPEDIGGDTLIHLRACVGMHVLSHAPRLDRELLRLLARQGETTTLSPALILELSRLSRADLPTVMTRIWRVRRLSYLLRDRHPQVLRSVNQVRRVERDLQRRYDQNERGVPRPTPLNALDITFPPPPFAAADCGPVSLTPASSTAELRHIGKTLKNCLDGGVNHYGLRIARGASAVFAVEEKSTGALIGALHLQRNGGEGARWATAELRGPRNEPLPSERESLIESWLEASQASPGDWTARHPIPPGLPNDEWIPF